MRIFLGFSCLWSFLFFSTILLAKPKAFVLPPYKVTASLTDSSKSYFKGPTAGGFPINISVKKIYEDIDLPSTGTTKEKLSYLLKSICPVANSAPGGYYKNQICNRDVALAGNARGALACTNMVLLDGARKAQFNAVFDQVNQQFVLNTNPRLSNTASNPPIQSLSVYASNPLPYPANETAKIEIRVYLPRFTQAARNALIAANIQWVAQRNLDWILWHEYVHVKDFKDALQAIQNYYVWSPNYTASLTSPMNRFDTTEKGADYINRSLQTWFKAQADQFEQKTNEFHRIEILEETDRARGLQAVPSFDARIQCYSEMAPEVTEE